MDFIEAFISKNSENNFYHYLLKNGAKAEIDNTILEIETLFPDEPLCFQKIMIRRYSNKIWEIPTKELCNGFLKLLKFLNITKINELAAGMGMLSALLSYYVKENNYQISINAYSKYNCNFLEDNRFTYYPVQNKKFKDYETSDPIVFYYH